MVNAAGFPQRQSRLDLTAKDAKSAKEMRGILNHDDTTDYAEDGTADKRR
jgi:hypothetical protein